jgi:hypothetical protein
MRKKPVSINPDEPKYASAAEIVRKAAERYLKPARRVRCEKCGHEQRLAADEPPTAT